MVMLGLQSCHPSGLLVPSAVKSFSLLYLKTLPVTSDLHVCPGTEEERGKRGDMVCPGSQGAGGGA